MRVEVPSRFATLVSIVSSDEAPDISEWLHPSEIEIGREIAIEGRRNEWVLARVAVKQLALSLGLCDDPSECIIPSRGVAPALQLRGLPSDLHLSISHSAHLAAAAIASGPVGVDIQVRRPVDERSRRFFLRDDEEDLVKPANEDRLLELWSAKEAALKATGVRLYRDVALREPAEDGNGTSFRFFAGRISGRVETTWLADGRVVLALARGESS